MSFESELRSALRRESPPPDFMNRVMRATANGGHPPTAVHRRASVAAAMLLVAIGGWTIHHIEQVREGERAKAQLMLALRITSQKLHETQQRLQR